MELLETLPVSQHDLFSREECDDLCHRVHSLREEWIPRSDFAFFSLGTASYLDAPDRYEEYVAAARRTNLLLRRLFASSL